MRGCRAYVIDDGGCVRGATERALHAPSRHGRQGTRLVHCSPACATCTWTRGNVGDFRKVEGKKVRTPKVRAVMRAKAQDALRAKTRILRPVIHGLAF